jgi:uncharacterized protein YdaU (DUF1376 family)
MKLYWADYHQDTRHLSREEHGAYFLLLGEAWNRGGFLPDDDALLARWALATADDWARLKPIVMAFFRPAPRGRWRHKRISEELASYSDVSRKRKAAGKRGGSSTRGKDSENPQANAQQTKGISPHNQNQNQNQSQKEEPPVVLLAPEVGSEAASPKPRGCRLPAEWTPGAELIAFAIREGFTEREADQIAAKFRDYWTAQPGKAGVKLDWPATWRNWVRNEAERRGVHGASPRPKRQGFV